MRRCAYVAAVLSLLVQPAIAAAAPPEPLFPDAWVSKQVVRQGAVPGHWTEGQVVKSGGTVVVNSGKIGFGHQIWVKNIGKARFVISAEAVGEYHGDLEYRTTISIDGVAQPHAQTDFVGHVHMNVRYLNPGDEMECTETVLQEVPFGKHKICFDTVVDPSNIFAESNETNNTASFCFNVNNQKLQVPATTKKPLIQQPQVQQPQLKGNAVK